MPKSFLWGCVLPLACVAVQGCGNLMTKDSHDRIVKGMRDELATLQVQAADSERLREENTRLTHENALLKAHNGAYAELSDELRGILDGLNQEGITRLPNGAWSIEAHLLFAAGSADITAPGRQTLRKFLDIWKGKQVKFKIVGHTDTDPILKTAQVYTTRTNVELGMHRALKVMEVLLNEGVAENLIAIESRGSSEPLAAENGTASSKKKNRRVEIYVLKQ
ncbi:MAG TPA: OmpA family protein [Planctomycetota bacterium]|nr:OmpA family protein [Planctomycetota bacterium]